MKRLVEFKIKSLELSEGFSFYSGSEDRKICAFTLVHPREGVSSVASVKAMKLTAGISDRDSYSDRVVFKESFRGDSELIIEVGFVNNMKSIEKVVSKLGSVALGGLLSIGTGGISSVVLKGVATAGGKSLIEQIFGQKMKPVTLAKLVVPLSGDSFTQTIDEDFITIKEIRPPSHIGGIPIPKGTAVGKIVLDLTDIA